MDNGVEEQGTYADRMNKVAMGVREEHSKLMSKKLKEKLLLLDNEKDIARVIISLMNDDNFKKYLEYEAIEIGRRLKDAFEAPADVAMKSATFGEQMAFNKGRYYQMEHFRRIRNNIVSKYLEWTKLEKEDIK